MGLLVRKQSPGCDKGLYVFPFVVSLSNHEATPFDKLRANGLR